MRALARCKRAYRRVAQFWNWFAHDFLYRPWVNAVLAFFCTLGMTWCALQGNVFAVILFLLAGCMALARTIDG